MEIKNFRVTIITKDGSTFNKMKVYFKNDSMKYSMDKIFGQNNHPFGDFFEVSNKNQWKEAMLMDKIRCENKVCKAVINKDEIETISFGFY